MHDDQAERFETIRDLVDEAFDSVRSLQRLTESSLQEIDHDSADQAACLQTIQQRCGEAVQALTDASETARHARSFQAQQHNEH